LRATEKKQKKQKEKAKKKKRKRKGKLALRGQATLNNDGCADIIVPRHSVCDTNGNSRTDALANAPDAMHAAMSMLVEKNMDIPNPSKPRGKSTPLIGLPSAIVDAKAELYRALRSADVRKAELARRMGIHKQQVERLLDLDHASRIEQLEAAFRALNLTIDIQLAA
jgi:antitoxin HicB